MYLVISDVIGADEVEEIRARIGKAEFRDGRETAGWHARLVKKNEQISRNDAEMRAVRKQIADRILGNPLFRIWARPKALTPLLLSRYQPGMTYGSHVDDAYMGGLRTDVSFTLFLSDPASYEGGGLVIETTAGEEEVKLPAGSLVAYPSTTLHRVEEVSSGERLAAVGWARSLIRDPASREILFDLETARQAVFDRDGKTPEFDLISKSLANLLRMWLED